MMKDGGVEPFERSDWLLFAVGALGGPTDAARRIGVKSYHDKQLVEPLLGQREAEMVVRLAKASGPSVMNLFEKRLCAGEQSAVTLITMGGVGLKCASRVC